MTMSPEMGKLNKKVKHKTQNGFKNRDVGNVSWNSNSWDDGEFCECVL